MELITWILSIIIGILVIRYVFFRKLNRLEELGVLHEKSWPLINSLAFVIFRRYHVTEGISKIYNRIEDAEYVGYYDMVDPAIMVRTPELIKDIAVKNFDHFVDHRRFLDANDDSMFGKNLFALRGEKWKEVRNLLSPAFTSSKMKSMFELMSSCGKNFVSNLADSSLVKSDVLDTKDAFTRYTNDVIATCAFGIAVDSVKDPKNDFYVLGRLGTNFDGLAILKFLLYGSFPKVAKFLRMKLFPPKVEEFFESVVRETIETRDRDGITRPDMIQLMMESRGKKMGSSPELTFKDMTAQAFVFFFGGFESTATLMCFAAQEIAANPDVQTKLREEMEEFLDKTNGELTYEAVNGMVYLDAVVSEALRLYPVLPFLDRQCVKTFELPPALPNRKPVTIEPGQTIIFPVYSIHRDPKYFSDPNKFDPDRFMGSRKNEIDPYAYFPFGVGPRMCIGNRFALLETKVLIVNLLKKFHLMPGPTMNTPMQFDPASFNMKPKGGFSLRIKPNDSSTGK